MARKINSYIWIAEIDHPAVKFATGRFMTKRAALKHEKAAVAAIDKVLSIKLEDIKMSYEATGCRHRAGVNVPRIPRVLKV